MTFFFFYLGHAPVNTILSIPQLEEDFVVSGSLSSVFLPSIGLHSLARIVSQME